MSADNLLVEERRARMAAERLLAQKQAELNEANKMLSRHARSLSEDLVETREEVVEVREDLERKTVEVDIAKRRLWSSVETIEDGFAVFDADSRLVIANPAYYGPFDGLECIRPGAHYEEIVEAALSEGVVDTGERSMAEWRDWMLARWNAKVPEPREIRLFNGAYVRLVDRRAPGGDTVTMALDITQAIRRQKALRAARNRAEAANRAKSAFLANMSHEIRTPMNGVVGMADLMAEHDLDDELMSYVDTIRTSGRALLTIINDVLDYSKIEADKLQLHPEPFDLEQTILDVIALIMPTVREKGLKLILDYDMFMPTRFAGDSLRFRQILTNLIGNAVKFTAEGHVLVRVLGLPADDGDVRVHITVEDTGIGIDAAHQAHVFGEFNQVEDERNRAYEGTGLGLAITRRLVELMGGEIWVESELGVGSCFGLSAQLPTVQEEPLPDAPAWLKSAQLIMVDDLNRSILAKRLIALGIEVSQTEIPKEGHANAASADVVIVDQKFCSCVTSAAIESAGTPVVVVSDPTSNASTCKSGRTLQKPHSRPSLMAILAGLPEPVAKPAPAEIEADTAERPLSPAPEVEGVTAEPPAAIGFRSRRRATTPAPEAPVAVEEPEPKISLEDPTPPAPLPDPVVVATPDPAPVPPAPPQADSPRKMRVLVAEDNKTNRFVFSKLVKACDIDLEFAENGHQAVEKFASFSPDLIFMDISMPGMDGKEATRTIRRQEEAEERARTRIVALTAHAMTGDGEEIMGHGLDAHLTKPFPKDLILAEIEANCPEGAVPPLPEPAQAAS